MKKLILMTFTLLLFILNGCNTNNAKHEDLFLKTYVQMSKLLNFEFTTILGDGSEAVPYMKNVVQIDLEDEKNGLIKYEIYTLGSLLSEYYAKYENEKLFIYFNGTWLETPIRPESDDFIFLKNYQSYKFIEEITLNQEKCHVYEFKFNGVAYLNSIMDMSTLFEGSLSEEQINDMFKRLTIKVTIDKDEYYIRQIDINLTEAITDYLNNNGNPTTLTTYDTSTSTTDITTSASSTSTTDTTDTTTSASSPSSTEPTTPTEPTEPIEIELNITVIYDQFNQINVSLPE